MNGTSDTDRTTWTGLARQSGSLTAQDICDILKAGYDSKVSTLKLGSIEVEYCHGREEQVNPPDMEYPPTEAPVEANPGSNEYRTPPDEELIAELQLAQLMTEDPVAYEQFVIDSQLEEGAIEDAEENSRATEQDL